MAGDQLRSLGASWQRFSLPARLTLLATTIAIGTSSAAQAAGFADDFNKDSVTFSTDFYSSEDANEAQGSYRQMDNYLLLEASTGGGSEASQLLELRDNGHDFRARVLFDAATDVAESDQAFAIAEVTSVLFSETDLSIDESLQSWIRGQISATTDGVNGYRISACINRETQDSFEPYPLFELGSDHCTKLVDFPLDQGGEFDLAMTADPSMSTVTFQVNDQQFDYTIDGEMLAPDVHNSSVLARHVGETGRAAIQVSEVTTSKKTWSLGSDSVIVGRYRLLDKPTDSALKGEQFRLSSDGEWLSFGTREASNYLEALVTLPSSENVLDERDDRVLTTLEIEMARDEASVISDDRFGRIRAYIDLDARGDSTRRIEYCVYQSLDAEFDERQGLLADGRRCANVPFLLELDKQYRLALFFNEEEKLLNIRVDGFAVDVDLSGDQQAWVPVQSKFIVNGDDKTPASVLIDDLRTEAQALTEMEIASGLTEPPVFPVPPDEADLVAPSTISGLVDELELPLDFVDDASAGATRVGYNSGMRQGRGQSGLRFVDGAIEMLTNSDAEESNGNWTELHMKPEGLLRKVAAVVSLRSETDLPATDSGADVSLRAVFYNDVAENGAGSRTGDVQVRIRLRQREDGRIEFRADMHRREEDGSNQRLEMSDEVRDALAALAAELDTDYTVGIELDTPNAQLIFRVDDFEVSVPVMSTIYAPHETEALVSVSHYGDSGRAVGRVKEFTVNDVTRNFAADDLLLGPYPPQWNARRNGVDVTIEDGRYRLYQDSSLTDRNADWYAFGKSTYVSADVVLSSESQLPTADSAVMAGISGYFYRDLDTNPAIGREGKVWARVAIRQNGGGNPYLIACAYRANDDNFDSSTELFTGIVDIDDDDCPQFALLAEKDVSYPMSIALDESAHTLTFTVGDESKVLAIATDIHDVGRQFHGARAQSEDGGVVIAYADNLAYSANAIPLAQSEARLNNTNRTVLDDDNTDGDSGVDPNEGDPTVVTDPPGKSSGGALDPLLLILLCVASLLVRRRSTAL